MSRTLAILILAVGGAASAAGAAEFKLEARPHDVLIIRGKRAPLVGRIEGEDALTIKFRKLNGQGSTWLKSQVVEVRRRCTLREAYEQATAAAGNDALAHLRLYESCVEAKLRKEAVAELQKAVQLDPKLMPAYRKLLAEARAAGDRDLEIRTLEAIRRAGFADVPLLLRAARLYARIGVPDKAGEPLDEALRLDAFHPEAKCKRAMLDLLRGDLAAAEEHIRAMLRRDDKNPFAWLAAGELAFARGRLDEASRAFGKAAEGSESPLPAAAVGAIALRKGQIRKAGRHYAAARKLRPDLAVAQAGEAMIAARDGRHKEAAVLAKRAAAAAPDRLDVALARAYVAEVAGNHKAALEIYEAVLSRERANVYAMAGSARCRLRQGDAAGARKRLAMALVVRPEFAPALRALGRMELARRPAEAVKFFRRLVAGGSPTPEDRCCLGLALLRLRRFDEAAEQFQKAGSDSVHGRIGLGYLAAARGRADEALAHFKEAVRLGDHRRYAERAIRRIALADARRAWSDDFARPDDARVLNGWTETEPPGTAISIAGNAALFEGRPTTDRRLVRLSRVQDKAFVSITAEAETGTEAASFVGVFVERPGAAPVLFGRLGGAAAVQRPGQARPRKLGKPVAQGRFTVGIEVVNRQRGVVRLLVGGRRVPGVADLTVPELAGAEGYVVGLFARPPKGGAVHCKFHNVKIVRSK